MFDFSMNFAMNTRRQEISFLFGYLLMKAEKAEMGYKLMK